MDLPTSEDLMRAVADAGWLLEQSVVRTLEQKGQNPRSGWAFADPDVSSTSREIDVWSYFRIGEDEDTPQVNTSFLVECKQSRNPYVAIGRSLDDWHFARSPLSHLLNVSVHEPDSTQGPSRSKWQRLGFDVLEREAGFDSFRAAQITRLDRGKGGKWQADNAGIFTSLVMPLAKATSATKLQESEHHRQVRLIFPTVVTSCPVLTIDTSDRVTRVIERDWVTVRRMLDTTHTRGNFEFYLVSEDNFPAFVDRCLNLAGFIATHLSARQPSDDS